jgi:hypothetical protein
MWWLTDFAAGQRAGKSSIRHFVSSRACPLNCPGSRCLSRLTNISRPARPQERHPSRNHILGALASFPTRSVARLWSFPGRAQRAPAPGSHRPPSRVGQRVSTSSLARLGLACMGAVFHRAHYVPAHLVGAESSLLGVVGGAGRHGSRLAPKPRWPLRQVCK